MSDTSNSDVTKARPPAAETMPAWLQMVCDHVSSVKFGTVQITVHDSRVVHVERAEKFRFDKPENDKR